MLSRFLGFFLIGNYKDYGLKKGNTNDRLLSSMGQVGAIANSLARILGGLSLQRFGFKKTFFVICIIGLAVSVTFPSIASNEICFFVWNFFTWCNYGSIVGNTTGVYALTFGTIMGN